MSTELYGPTYVGDYDDTCEQCGKENTVAVHSDKPTWTCHWCEYTNTVKDEDAA